MAFLEELQKYSRGKREEAQKAGLILLGLVVGFVLACMFVYSYLADLFN